MRDEFEHFHFIPRSSLLLNKCIGDMISSLVSKDNTSGSVKIEATEHSHLGYPVTKKRNRNKAIEGKEVIIPIQYYPQPLEGESVTLLFIHNHQEGRDPLSVSSSHSVAPTGERRIYCVELSKSACCLFHKTTPTVTKPSRSA